MIILIPLNGIGERFRINGFDRPKGLILVEDKPIIYWLLDNINYTNIDFVYIVYNEEYEKYEFESNIINRYPIVKFVFLKLTFLTNGALHTVSFALNNLIDNNYKDDNIICIDADNFYTTDIIKLWDGTNSIITFNDGKNNKNPIFSYIKINDENKIIDIKEKEFIDNNKIACTGAYGFSSYKELYRYSKHVIDNNYIVKNEYYISSVIKYMINDNIYFNNINIDNKYYFSLGTPELIKRFEYIFLLDLDGTLIDTDDLYIEIWNKLLNNINNQSVNKDYYIKNIKSKCDIDFLKSIIPDITISEITKISREKDELFKKNINKIKLFDGVIEFLEQLNNSRTAIVTNCNKITAINILNHFNIYKYINLIISANDCNNGKPHKEPYLNAKYYFNDNKYNKYIVFEDSYIGYLSAYNADIDNIYMKLNDKNDKNDKNDFYNYNEINIDFIINTINNKNIITNFFNTSNIKYDFNNRGGGYICDICKYSIVNDDNNVDTILKIANINNSLTITAKKLDLYNNEIYFYKEIFKNIKDIINIPYCYNASYINQSIILNDLKCYNGCFNMDLNSNYELIYNIINNISNIHIKHHYKNYNDIPVYLQKVRTIKDFNYYNILIKDRYDKFILDNKEYFDKSFIKLFDNIKNNFSTIINELSTYPLSLCHGDLKSPNIFYKDYNIPFFLDFQYINLNKGISDIIFLLIESIDFNENLYNNIIQYYYDIIIKNNINYDYNDYIKDLKNSLSIFPFIVAVWFNTENKNNLTDKDFPLRFLKKLMKYYKYVFKDNF
jgi:beta-phosphoglucomutase-like phosphatase (HAD superfamily)/choline kinase